MSKTVSRLRARHFIAAAAIAGAVASGAVALHHAQSQPSAAPSCHARAVGAFVMNVLRPHL